MSEESPSQGKSARCNSSREVLWKEARSILCKVFVYNAYVHIPNEKRQKLDPELEKCIHVGYSLEKKGYKCFMPCTQKVHVSQDIFFNESASWYNLKSTPPEPAMNDLHNTDKLRSLPEESLISTTLRGPQQPPSD